MEKATVEQIRSTRMEGALGWDTKLGDGTTAYFYSAKVYFPSKLKPGELKDGLCGLVKDLMGDEFTGKNGLPYFDDKEWLHFNFENRDRSAKVFDLELETHIMKYGPELQNKEEYMVDCKIHAREKSKKSENLVFTKVAEFAQKYGEIEAPEPEPEPEPIVPYKGKEIDISAEVAKIDFEKLRNIALRRPIEGTRFENANNLGMGIYLAETGRLRPDNAMMIMTYEGKGLFTIIGEWEDVDIDPRTDLIRRDSRGQGLEYVQLDYKDLKNYNIELNGEKLDRDVKRAVVAYAKISSYIREHGEFHPFEVKETDRPEFKSIFPQKILDFSQPPADIKLQLFEYLTEKF
ncbi:hypothetical protein KY345_02195 [Candidatus Woesearchaeota archaeon]|nr:hypothetical protein [Candidatus Woesearchaeota archaeon]